MRTKRKLTDQEIDRFYLWLHEYPGYKELVRQRISDEQKRRRRIDFRFATRKGNEHMAVDKLGREVEGCG
jgi:hypothetical protein